MNRLVLIVTALVAWVVPASAEEDCRLTLSASLPMVGDTPDRIVIPASTEGRPLTLMVDTGSPFSGLSPEAVARLSLPPHLITAAVDIKFPLAGGRVTHYVQITNFKLGDMTANRAQFVVMPPTGEHIDGLIGADFLRQFDVEFDFAAGKMNLFQPHPCAGKVVYWNRSGAPVAVIPFLASRDDPHIRFNVTLDGKAVPSVLDTGAPTTSISLAAASSWFSVDEHSQGVKPLSHGAFSYAFNRLDFDGVAVDKPDIRLRHETSSNQLNYEGLLGLNVLRHLHLYIAYKEKKLYATAATAR